MNIFLDDERQPSDVTWIELPNYGWNIIRNYQDFVALITKYGLPTFISFDNDLHESHYQEYMRARLSGTHFNYEKMIIPTGYHCALWLKGYVLKNNLKIPPFLVHSRNEFAQQDIPNLLLDKKLNYP